LLPGHLPQQVRDYRPAVFPAAARPGSLSQSRDQLEREVIQKVLENRDCTGAQAASALGISRVTLYKKVKKYGLTWNPSQAAATKVHTRNARAGRSAEDSPFPHPIRRRSQAPDSLQTSA
jgi:hypothetical protein